MGDHALHGGKGCRVNVEALTYGFQKQPSSLEVGHFFEVLHQPDDHDVFFVPFESFVDLATCPEQFYTQLGEPLGMHVFSTHGHALKLIDQLIESVKALFSPFLWKLVAQVSCCVDAP